MTIKWAFETRRNLKSKINELQKELNDVENHLKNCISDNETRCGITHVVTKSKSVSYAKAIAAALPVLPKKAGTILNRAIKDHTTSHPRHTFKEANE